MTLSPSTIVTDGNGPYNVLIGSSTAPGHLVITASDVNAGLSGHVDVTQTISGSMLSLVTMRWAFRYTPAYTAVLSLSVYGVPAGAGVLVACHGRGCPFTNHLDLIGQTAQCADGGNGNDGNGNDGNGNGNEGDVSGCGCGGDGHDGSGCHWQAGYGTRATIGVARHLRQRRLGVGTQITVAITRPGWIGKYYRFTMRAGRGPRVQIACLAPGETRPGAAC
jgi:hypothetical protein